MGHPIKNVSPTFVKSKRAKMIVKKQVVFKLILSLMVAIGGNKTFAQDTHLKITIVGKTELTATLVDNSSTAALIELLKKAPLTIEMRDHGNMEKVGSIGTTLPRNDEQITTEPGDLILYQGNALVIYYAPNSWNFTRLGKINNSTQDQLKAILGTGNVIVTLKLADTSTDVRQKEGQGNIFQVFPNPVKDQLKVSGQFETLALININGNKVFETKENSMDISDIAPGTYFLNIESGNNEPVVKKIIKYN